MTTVKLLGGRYDGAEVDLPLDLEAFKRIIAVCIWPDESVPAAPNAHRLPASSVHGAKFTVYDDIEKVPQFAGTYLKGSDGKFYRPSILPPL